MGAGNRLGRCGLAACPFHSSTRFLLANRDLEWHHLVMTFSCASCGATYKWSQEKAGKSARCKCGATITVPSEAPGEEELYDIAPPPAPTPVMAIPVAQSRPAIGYESKTVRQAETDVDTLKQFTIPVALLGAGVLVEVLAGLLGKASMNRAMLSLGTSMAIQTTVMTAGVLLAAWLRGIELGSFKTAILRLAAISVAAPAAMTLLLLPLKFIPFGVLIAWLASFCFYFALLGLLFDLDQEDTWWLVMVIFLLKLGLFFGAYFLLK